VTALRLGTRGSALALAQADAVGRALDVPFELVKITTAGDVDRARGDKSRWVGALEAALLSGEIDLAVHSAKDAPGELAAGTEIAATPRRAEPFDVLVGEDALASVREGARVGTSALRRRAQLLAARADLEVRELRGNVDTRLAKRVAGEVDVLVLAAAGLERLGRRGEAGALLHGGVFVPAAGQGVIAVQARTGSPAAEAAQAADHASTHAALDAERHVVRALEATCHTPVGVLSSGGRVRAFVGLPDGSSHLVEEAPTAEEVTARLLAAGAAEILRAAAA
jgi:hydroxymethylbilane synthase